MFVLIIASFVTTVELVMNAHFHGLYKVLGIFIPLIVTNCTIIGRAEAFASRNRASHAWSTACRSASASPSHWWCSAAAELIGQGTLFDGAHLMFGEAARAWRWSIGDDYPGILLAVLPPGISWDWV